MSVLSSFLLFFPLYVLTRRIPYLFVYRYIEVKNFSNGGDLIDGDENKTYDMTYGILSIEVETYVGLLVSFSLAALYFAAQASYLFCFISLLLSLGSYLKSSKCIAARAVFKKCWEDALEEDSSE